MTAKIQKNKCTVAVVSKQFIGKYEILSKRKAT
jgi:hypothetical protein